MEITLSDENIISRNPDDLLISQLRDVRSEVQRQNSEINISREDLLKKKREFERLNQPKDLISPDQEMRFSKRSTSLAYNENSLSVGSENLTEILKERLL